MIYNIFNRMTAMPFDRACVVDVETTTRGPEGDRSSPFKPLLSLSGTGGYLNEMILVGTLQVSTGEIRIYRPAGFIMSNGSLLVGHNFKFDLRWMYRYGLDRHVNVNVWDTQVVEYLLSGQKTKMASLEDCCAIHSIPFTKNPEVAEWIDAGKDLGMFSIDKLSTYLKEDLLATSLLYKAQLAKVHAMPEPHRSRFLTLIAIQGRLTILLAQMEVAGTYMNLDELRLMSRKIEAQFLVVYKAIHEAIKGVLTPDSIVTPELANLNSTLSYVLFGDAPKRKGIPYELKQLDGTYKNGNPKYRTVTKTLTLKPGADTNKIRSHKTVNAHGTGYSVDDKMLSMIGSNPNTFGIFRSTLATTVLEKRKLEKLYGTYLKSLEEKGLPTIAKDTIVIHTNFNQTVTHTGRLSSSSPNWQNNPPAIKNLIVPRHKKGCILSADFKQLEMCGAAQLSQDRVLLNIINTGRDIHTEVGRTKYGRDPTEEERRQIKAVVFGTLYGGTPWGLSYSTGMDQRFIQEVQGALFATFKSLSLYYRQSLDEVGKRAVNTMVGGKLERSSTINSVTGRRYYYEKEPKGWPVNKIKNNPIQGWATGDIVPAYACYLHHLMLYYPECNKIFGETNIINIIHDDIVLDVEDSSQVPLIQQFMEGALELFPEFYKLWTGTSLDVKLKLNFKVKGVKEDAED